MRRTFTGFMMAMLLLMAALGVTGCGGARTVAIDYGDAASFEAALNAGENLEGKVVQFEAKELHPDSIAGYDVWAGEHLNFISSRNPDIKAGETVVVRAREITSTLGSWFIKYEKVKKAEVTEVTISSGTGNAAPAGAGTQAVQGEQRAELGMPKTPAASGGAANAGAASFTVSKEEKKAQELPLEITDYGWYFSGASSYTGSVYVNFCGMVHNPNEELIAEFPKVCVTVRDGDGSILGTETQTGGIVMPGDTVTLCGMLSMSASDFTGDEKIGFEVEWSDFSTGSSLYEQVRSTDFVFSNVSERKSSGESRITGEVSNTSAVDLDMANVSLILRKGGKIVFVENTFVDSLRAGQTKAFEFQRYEGFPEYDAIECSAQAW